MKKFLYDEIANRWLKDCDSVWIYSDPHFGDLESYKFRFPNAFPIPENMDEEECKLNHEHRVKIFDNEQIKNINSKAGKNSCLIILGDVGDLECVKKLRAKRKILIMGNHDRGATNYKRQIIEVEHNSDTCPKCGGKVVYDDATFHNCGLGYAWCDTCGTVEPKDDVYEDNHLFDEVYEGPIMINDRTILSHEPVFAGVPYFKNIHGHVHKSDYKGDDHHLNCCAEAINYEPINLLGLFKKGFLKNIDSIHRMTIDTAIARKRRK